MASFSLYRKETGELYDLYDVSKWILDDLEQNGYKRSINVLRKWKKEPPSEEVLSDLKFVINNSIATICPNNNSMLYSLLVHFGLNVEEHKKQEINNKKFVAIVSTIFGGTKRHFVYCVGVFDDENEAIDAIIKYAISTYDYFYFEYEEIIMKEQNRTDDGGIRLMMDVRARIIKEAASLVDKFKIDYFDKMMTEEVIEGGHSDQWYWDIQEI